MVCLDQIDTKAGKLEDCCIQGDAVIGIEKKKKKTQGPSKKKQTYVQKGKSTIRRGSHIIWKYFEL